MTLIVNKKFEGYSLPTIEGHVCTFEYKLIRNYVERNLQDKDSILLPSFLTYTLVPSAFWGTVAKIHFTLDNKRGAERTGS